MAVVSNFSKAYMARRCLHLHYLLSVKAIFVFIFFSLISFTVVAQKDRGLLKVSANGHYLQYEDGTPFFWLGDTGWNLFLRLRLEDVIKYFDNRRSKGFNVIQAVIMPQIDTLEGYNKYGNLPLVDTDPDHPNEAYFQFVDTVIAIAAKKGLIMALLPTWGDKVTLKYGGNGPVIFNTQTAFRFGKYLGNRYKRFDNIVWVLGGDRPPQDDKEDFKPVYKAMAEGIHEGSGRRYLFSFHPGGYVWESSIYLHNESWMDFNMIQSGHAELDQPVWKSVLRDWYLKPTKPVIDAEPCYEDHPINPWHGGWTPAKGRFNEYDVRRQLYRSVFAGAFGVTYGHHSVWQFYDSMYEKITYADRYWYQALDRPAAYQAGYLRKLIESRPYLNRIPDTTIILKGQGVKSDYITAFRDSLGRYMMIYLPVGKTITINTAFIQSKKIRTSWFNPKTGKTIGSSTVANKSKMSFTSPTTGKGNDWVLLIDDAKKQYKIKSPNRLQLF